MVAYLSIQSLIPIDRSRSCFRVDRLRKQDDKLAPRVTPLTFKVDITVVESLVGRRLLPMEIALPQKYHKYLTKPQTSVPLIASTGHPLGFAG
jgi:hypothetical protein